MERIFKLGFMGVLAVLLVILTPMLIENQKATDILVIQSVFGELTVHTVPGPHWQGFGTVSTYPRQAQYSFCSMGEGILCEGSTAPSKKLRFNDGGHANLNGFVLWEMPVDAKSIIEIHKRFGGAEAVQSRAVAKMIDGAVYLAGPLMSSTESSGSRRAELVQVINDQAENGVYVTHSENITVVDPITKEQKTESVTKIAMGPNGLPKRQQGSVLAELNIKLQPMSISELTYDDIVEKQIKQRQEATTAVQIAVANSIRAQQDAKTAEATGMAKAATAKWAQEVLKATEVTKAQQALEVAQLDAKTAEQTKQTQVLLGQGEAERKRLVMSADGALTAKIDAWTKAQGYWADAYARNTSAMVPQIVMGGGDGANTNSVNSMQNIMSLVGIKAAKDLGLDLSQVKK